jgi:phosphoglycolate phosphatase
VSSSPINGKGGLEVLRAILFDLDGTLVDSVADLHAAANLLLAERGLPAIDRATLKSFIGNGIAMLVERCLRHHGAALDDRSAAVRRFKQIYERLGHHNTELYEGVASALEQLAKRGYRLALCTNKDTSPSRQILTRLHIEEFFTVVIGGDSLHAVKPDPRLLIAAADGCDATIPKAIANPPSRRWRRLPVSRISGPCRNWWRRSATPSDDEKGLRRRAV